MQAIPHVLAVDDHREIRMVRAQYLERRGMRANAAEGAAAAPGL